MGSTSDQPLKCLLLQRKPSKPKCFLGFILAGCGTPIPRFLCNKQLLNSSVKIEEGGGKSSFDLVASRGHILKSKLCAKDCCKDVSSKKRGQPYFVQIEVNCIFIKINIKNYHLIQQDKLKIVALFNIFLFIQTRLLQWCNLTDLKNSAVGMGDTMSTLLMFQGLYFRPALVCLVD